MKAIDLTHQYGYHLKADMQLAYSHPQCWAYNKQLEEVILEKAILEAYHCLLFEQVTELHVSVISTETAKAS